MIRYVGRNVSVGWNGPSGRITASSVGQHPYIGCCYMIRYVGRNVSVGGTPSGRITAALSSVGLFDK